MNRRLVSIGLISLSLLIVGCSRNAEHASQGAPQNASSLEGKLVRLDQGSDFETAKVYIVKDGRKQWITSAEWIANHGFRLPDDVRPVSKAVLDTIPEGPQINTPN